MYNCVFCFRRCPATTHQHLFGFVAVCICSYYKFSGFMAAVWNCWYMKGTPEVTGTKKHKTFFFYKTLIVINILHALLFNLSNLQTHLCHFWSLQEMVTPTN